MKVALQIDEPWDHGSALTAKWWIGTLDREDWVALDEPVPFRGREGRRVKVGPRYEGDSLATLHDGKGITENYQLETLAGEFALVGSLKKVGW